MLHHCMWAQGLVADLVSAVGVSTSAKQLLGNIQVACACSPVQSSAAFIIACLHELLAAEPQEGILLQTLHANASQQVV